jgi:hypothetical protein
VPLAGLQDEDAVAGPPDLRVQSGILPNVPQVKAKSDVGPVHRVEEVQRLANRPDSGFQVHGRRVERLQCKPHAVVGGQAGQVPQPVRRGLDRPGDEWGNAFDALLQPRRAGIQAPRLRLHLAGEERAHQWLHGTDCQATEFFSTLPSIADGFQLRTWRGGSQAGQPKVPPVARGLLDRGPMRLEATPWPPRVFFTEAGLAALRAMMADRRLANPVTFAHVRREFGIDPDPKEP